MTAAAAEAVQSPRRFLCDLLWEFDSAGRVSMISITSPATGRVLTVVRASVAVGGVGFKDFGPELLDRFKTLLGQSRSSTAPTAARAKAPFTRDELAAFKRVHDLQMGARR